MNLLRACMFVLPFFTLNIAACVAPDAEDGLEDGLDAPSSDSSDDAVESIGEASSALSIGSGVQRLPAHGGGGGNTRTLVCPAGQVMTGVYGRSGSEVDQLGAYCAPLRANGSLGASQPIGSHGGNGGNAVSAHCPTNQVMAGIYGRAGSRVDEIGIRCIGASLWLHGGTPSYVRMGGGHGGNWFDDTCQRQYVIRSLYLRTGSRVDNVQGVCHHLVGP